MRFLTASLILISGLTAKAATVGTPQPIELSPGVNQIDCAQLMVDQMIKLSQFTDITTKVSPAKPTFDIGEFLARYGQKFAFKMETYDFTGKDLAGNPFTGSVTVSLTDKIHEDARTGDQIPYRLCSVVDLPKISTFILMNKRGTHILTNKSED